MNPVLARRIAASLGFLAVALGAFGAHGLKKILAEHDTRPIWETAVLYHLVHAVVLFVLAERKQFPRLAGWGFLAGIVIFSGSLYLLAVTNARWLGAITPLGGLSLLLGWVGLFKGGAAGREK